MKERRKFLRVPTRDTLRYREMAIPKDLFAENSAQARDMSPGGIQFESPKSIPQGTVLKLQIELKDWARYMNSPDSACFEGKPLKILGEVMHCVKNAADGTYRIGVQFLGLDAKFQDAILNYLAEAFQEE